MRVQHSAAHPARDTDALRNSDSCTAVVTVRNPINGGVSHRSVTSRVGHSRLCGVWEYSQTTIIHKCIVRSYAAYIHLKHVRLMSCLHSTVLVRSHFHRPVLTSFLAKLIMAAIADRRVSLATSSRELSTFSAIPVSTIHPLAFRPRRSVLA